MFRRQPPLAPFSPRPLGPGRSPDETEAWAADDDFATFEQGADRVMAPELSFEEKERLVREQIPTALSGLATAATSSNLNPEERGNMARIAATLGGDLTSALEGPQLAPWERASMEETARLAHGRGGVDFTFDPDVGAEGKAAMRNGRANVRLDPTKFVSRDGVVDVDKLKAVLAHEGRHVYDQRTLGFTDVAYPASDPDKTFKNLDQYRWTEQNAFRLEDVLNRAIGRQSPDHLGASAADSPDSFAEGVVGAIRYARPDFKDYGSGKGGRRGR